MNPIEARFRPGPAKTWLIVTVAFAIPVMLTMTAFIIGLLGWVIRHNTRAGPIIATIAISLPVAVVMLWADLVFVRMAMSTWRYGVRAEVALRVDEQGVHAREFVRGRFKTLPWDQVGTIGFMPMGGLYIEPADHKSWLREQPLWKRLSLWVFRRKHGYLPALACGLAMDPSAAQLAEELAKIRDANLAGEAAEVK